jgi:8-oxo-dGTP pyrophosphatase MutT (NUDIX family)
MKSKIKVIIYRTIYRLAKIYWKICKSKTFGARILLFDKIAQEFLFVLPHGSSKYNLCGGRSNNNELPEKTALRELCEETGISLVVADFCLGTYYNEKEGKKDTITIFVKEIKTKQESEKIRENLKKMFVGSLFLNMRILLAKIQL